MEKIVIFIECQALEKVRQIENKAEVEYLMRKSKYIDNSKIKYSLEVTFNRKQFESRTKLYFALQL